MIKILCHGHVPELSAAIQSRLCPDSLYVSSRNGQVRQIYSHSAPRLPVPKMRVMSATDFFYRKSSHLDRFSIIPWSFIDITSAYSPLISGNALRIYQGK
jgi:hypothetical protein